MRKDLLGIDDLTRDDIYRVLDTAEAMREIGERPIKKVPTLRGKTVVNLFHEPIPERGLRSRSPRSA